MNYDYTSASSGWVLLLILLMGILSCRPGELPPKPSEITKQQREQLGNTIRDAILDDPHNFTVLENLPDYVELRNHLEELYRQAIYSIREDATSGADKWTNTRKWEVHILVSPEKQAFCLPGGHFFISTGFLKAIEQDYELYYLMTFEALLMNERHLFNKLISLANNPATLVEVAETTKSDEGINAMLLGINIAYDIQFLDGGIIQQLDDLTLVTICESSSIDIMGVLPVLEFLHNGDIWLNNRPSYSNRAQYIDQHEIKTLSDCIDNTKKWTKLSGTYKRLTENLP